MFPLARQRLLAWILPALLLFAQQSALAHLVSHQSDQSPPSQEKSLAHLKLCGKCLFAEKLSSTAPQEHAPFVVMVGAYAPTVSVPTACIPAVTGRYACRDPPAQI